MSDEDAGPRSAPGPSRTLAVERPGSAAGRDRTGRDRVRYRLRIGAHGRRRVGEQTFGVGPTSEIVAQGVPLTL
ncbi:hypothetical protein A5708_15655 [Mycobacterium colombiense]|uniref:Uncharacterized protein n=1 Tax=Mycobacterium colombiense TaxID=339268 RepID=A0A1A2Z710_9MYCO|nr:hypothetical protein A5708_15655 [Mycobacterium colombiense]